VPTSLKVAAAKICKNHIICSPVAGPISLNIRHLIGIPDGRTAMTRWTLIDTTYSAMASRWWTPCCSKYDRLFTCMMCCAVNTAFPTNWIWWLTFSVSTFWLTSLSGVSNYYLRDMRDINLVCTRVVPIQQHSRTCMLAAMWQ
jgi:hypothetical protein